MIARFPRLAAWLTAVVLIAITTAGSLMGLRLLPPPAPAAASAHHVHGLIVAIHDGHEFALEVPGQRGMEWFHIAPGAPISVAHLWRHLHERAPTDVTYQVENSGMLVAMSAD
jgi:hypothetical protein